MIAIQVSALDYPHFGINDIGCDSCHFIYGTEPSLLPPWTNHVSQHIDDTQYNTLCWSCHNDTDAPYVRTHSSRTIDNSYGNWTVECRVCHNPHYQKQKEYGSSSYLYSGTSASVTATAITKTGPDWPDDYEGMIVIPNVSQNKYIYEITGNTGTTLTVDGPMDLTKVTAGNTFAILYGNLINKAIDLSKITITPAKSGSKTTRFFRTTLSKSFADGDATYDGICEVCHTQTTHFRNGAYGGDPTYTNPAHTNVGSPAGTNCTTCHKHINGFAHGGSGGTGCDDCHGHDAGYGGATGGKGTYVAHSTHTENDSDDLRGPNVGCGTCHNTSSFPNFADGVSYADYKSGAQMTTVCNPCHSPGGTYNGVSDSAVGAKNNWSSVAGSESRIYEATGALKAGKEKWCATCHDESPSQIQSVNAPNVVGDEDGSYTYGAGWGFYKTGHGLSASQSYPASGGVTAGAGKGCLDCHDSTTAHIDGLARTFDDQNSNNLDPGYYRQGYRLKMFAAGEGTGATGREPLLVPYPGSAGINANNYRLCVSCHASGPFTDSEDTNTNFKTRYAPTDPEVNRHEYHLRYTGFGYRASSDWSESSCTSGSPGSCNSRITCTTCHNVHGSTRLAMVRDGKLVNREPGLKIWYYNSNLVTYDSPPETEPTPPTVPLAASGGTVWSAGSSDNLCSHCHGNDWLTTETRGPFQDLQQAPTLAWTGETNYTTDGVNPNSGTSGSNFVFRVKYTDTNNDAPVFIEVWVDENDDGDYDDGGEKLSMSEADAGDTNYTDGKIYTKTWALLKTGDNNFNYRFYASDGQVATGPPVSDSTVTITNNIPTLAWTEETNYVSDGVNPNSGGNGYTFVFRVKYTDMDDEAPSAIQVWIDLNDDGDYDDANEKNNMTVDGGDGDYANGELFTKSLALAYAGDGNLNYRFYASDGTAVATGSPVSDSIVTVSLSANSAPTLGWTTADCLISGVRPALGATGAPYEFRVNYSDPDDDVPSPIQIWIDLNDDGDYDDANEKNNMTVEGGDGNYINGEIFKYTAAIDYAGNGVLNHRFYASDGTDEATGVPTSDGTLTVVNTTYKVRPSGGSGWSGTIADALTASPASSTVLVYPNDDFTAATYAGGLSNINKTNRTLQSVCGADFTIISGGGTVYSLQGNDGAVIDGFTITGGTTYGIYANSDSLTVKNSKIHSNPTGIWLNNGCNPVSIQNVSIYSNTSYGVNSPSTLNLVSITNSNIYDNGGGATNGPGINLNGGAGTHTITGSTFTGNTTTGNGGVIYCNACTMTIDDSTFNDNTAGAGGAIYLLNAATATITDTYIQGNSVTGNGGGINVATSTGHAIMTNVMITGNKASTNGGAIYEGGYSDCLFCTISGNYAGSLGGAVYHLNSVTSTFKNSILYNNEAASEPNYQEIYSVGSRWQNVDVYYTLIDQVPGSASLPYGYESIEGNDNTNNPDFVSPIADPSLDAPTTGGNFRLQSGSPAANMASSSWTIDHDIFGDSRPLSGGYDMGADEYAGGGDATLPSSSVSAPTNGSAFNLASADPYTISGLASDDVAVTGIEVSTNGGGSWTATTCTGCPGASVTWTYTWTLPADGTYTVRSRATDSSSNFEAPAAGNTVTIDRTRPTVSSTNPTNGATAVTLNSDVTVNWDGNVDCTTVNTTNIMISGGGWALSSCSGSQAVFATGGQANSTAYTVTVGTSVKDVAGNTMAADYQFSFTTEALGTIPSAPAIGTPSTLSTTSIRWNFADTADNETGFKAHDSSHTVKASSATPDLTYLDESGLTANTEYTRHIHAYNGYGDSTGSADASQYTLSVTPNVTANKSVSTWYNTTDVIFTNAAGFGAGGVQYYRYVWDQNATYTFNDSETQWTTGTLTKTSTANGSWYLHVKSFNGDNDANGTQDYGPYYYDGTAPSSSNLNPANGATGVAVTGNLTLTLSDAHSGVEWTSFQIQLSGDGYLQTYTDLDTEIVSNTGTSASYDVTVNPDTDFPSNKVITVTVDASDISGNALTPPTWSFTTTDGANNTPVLSWATANCLTEGVRPRTGAINANYEFRVVYSDADSQCPSAIQVTVNGTPYDLTTNDGASCQTGRTYYRTITIASAGDLNYAYSASDGAASATGGPTSNHVVSVINTTYVVRPSGGTYNTIQAAVTASSDPSTILVYPNSDFTAATYSSFIISTAVGVKHNRTVQSVCGADLTIVSGGSDVVSCSNGNGNSVDGFSVTGGSSRGVYKSCNVSQNFTLKNSKVYSNTGAGVYAAAACQLDIQNTDIYSNTGGGIYMQNNTSRLSVSDSEIYSNSGVANGAGINIGSGNAGTTHTITNTTIRNNTASSYGGAIYCNVCTFNIQDSVINDNEATSYFGGALYCTNTCNLTFDDCTVNGNTSTAGGAFYFNSNTAAVTITDTFIQGNEATSSGGGAIFVNAGYANLTNVMLTGNKSAGRGGAIYMNNGYTNCTFCTISGNYSATQGGGIYLLNNYTSSLKNSIVYNNDAGSPTNANFKQIETNVRYSYMDVYNTLINQSPGNGTYPNNLSYENMGGNLTASNPNFVTPIANPSTDTPTPSGDFRIQSGSPAVNAGSSSYTSDHDIFDGTPGSRPKGSVYDMGAHEKE